MEGFLNKVVFNSAAMKYMRSGLVPFIESAEAIFLWAETGSGMGFIARAVHEASKRPGKFLTVPGFSLDGDTVKQQFLGIDDQQGWLEEAHNGTIFLKRISEAPLDVQQFLLHLVGNQSVDGRIKFLRMGKTENLEMNVRFIFSMAHGFNMALQDGLLRRDFASEMKKRGRIFRIPPLREREEDIIPIAENFFAPLNQKYNQSISAIDQSAQNILTNYIWPGNIDELKRVIEEIFANYPGITTISEEHIPEHLQNPRITVDNYSFKLKDDAKFIGKILSPMLKLESENKKLSLSTDRLVEIIRVEDDHFSPPKFQYFLFRLNDGSQITGNILDKKIIVETSFDASYQFNPQNLSSMYPVIVDFQTE